MDCKRVVVAIGGRKDPGGGEPVFTAANQDEVVAVLAALQDAHGEAGASECGEGSGGSVGAGHSGLPVPGVVALGPDEKVAHLKF